MAETATAPIREFTPRPFGVGDTLHFLHIPKTAGRSVRVVLEEQFDFGQQFPGVVLAQLVARPPSEVRQWRLFCGHYGKYLHTLLGFEPTVITFLRDPIARSISHYRDLKTRENSWLHEYVNTHTFDEFVADEMMSSELINLQCRFLALDDIDADHYGYSRQRLDDLPGLRRKYLDRGMFDRAMETLDSLAFVGLQERFDDSLQLLAATFGWQPPRRAPKRNTARAPFDESEISQSTLDHLAELTAHDRELYDHAAKRFEAEFAAIDAAALDAAYAQRLGSLPKTDQVRLGFGKAINGRGWHGRERVGGGVVRWTGPDATASLDLPLITSRRLRLRFHCGAEEIDVVESLRVRVNGAEVPARSWQIEDPATAARVFDVMLPIELLARGAAFTRIEFEVDRVTGPEDRAEGAEEKRRLGLRFHWLEVFPDEH